MSSDPNRVPEFYEGGSGTPLVLMHGFGATWRMWKPLLPLLESHHRVLAPTLPGHPGGVAMKQRATPVAIAEAFAEQLRARGVDRAHFVGQSMGGWLIWEMARLGLARSALGLSPAGAWRDEAVKAAFMRRARRTFKLLPYLVPPMSLAMSSTRLRKRLLANEMEYGERVSAADARDALRRVSKLTIATEYLDEHLPPMAPLPSDCKVPLRVVWGGCDRTLPFEQYGQPLLDLLRLKSHITLPGCGHNPVHDDTQAVASTILEFTRMVDRA